MKNLFLFLIVIGLFACNQTKEKPATEKTGSFYGVFEHGNFKDYITFDIQKNESSQYEVFFSSLEQNAFKIPFREVTTSGDSINFKLQSDFYTYNFKSKWVDGNNKIQGTLYIDTISVPFSLDKTLSDHSSNSSSQEVSFDSNGTEINGTIWQPKNNSDKALVIVTSSGNSNRSASRAESILWAKRGFTVFHYDKRGTGETKGNWQTATMENLLADDINAIKYFSQKTGIPIHQIGIKGSSQGATKIPFILNHLKDLKFGISVSCPGVSLYESDLNYWKNRNKEALGAYLPEAANLQRKVFELIAGTRSKESFLKVMEKEQSKPWFSQVWIPNLDEVQIDSKLLFSPIPHFEKTKQPVLVIQGTNDEIIPQNSHLLIASALDKAENKTYKSVLLNGANHSMYQVSESDFPYWSKLHSDYFSSIQNWISKISE